MADGEETWRGRWWLNLLVALFWPATSGLTEQAGQSWGAGRSRDGYKGRRISQLPDWLAFVTR